MAPKLEIGDCEIGELWRRYRPLEGHDDQANLILALIRMLIVQQARNIQYGKWPERLSTRCGHPESFGGK
jgi:hypothetical protein